MLTPRYDEAFRYAHELHRNQRRKQTSIPYISHLMTVSSLVMEHGGDEDQAIAGLLHDAPEDAGGRPVLEDIRLRFGSGVATIVEDCTDSWIIPKPEWRPRKETYLGTLAEKPARSLLVTLADKTHNAETILEDYRQHGDAVWERFSGGREGSRWYYRTCHVILAQRLPGPLADRLGHAVRGFHAD